MLDGWRFRDAEAAARAFIAWIGVCLVLSLAGFHARWDTLPSGIDVALGWTLVAPFALPKGFTDLVGLTGEHSLRGVLPAAAAFWMVVVGLALALVRTRHVGVFVVGAVLLAAASWGWLRVAVGMLGL